MYDGNVQHRARTVGIFTLTDGPLAPDGGYLQCRVMAVGQAEQIMLAPLNEADAEVWGAIIRTVTLPQLRLIIESFYAAVARSERATG